MSVPNAHRHYQRATVETASPGKLVLMLFDGAIRFLEQAKGHLGASRPKEAHEAIVRAENIVSELMSSLDMDQGGDIARNLLAVYEFVFMRLVDANMRKDPAPIEEVLPLLHNLRTSWGAAIAQHNAETHSDQPQLAIQSVEQNTVPRLFGSRGNGNGQTKAGGPGNGDTQSAAAAEATSEDSAPPTPAGPPQLGPIYRKPRPPEPDAPPPPAGSLDIVT